MRGRGGMEVEQLAVDLEGRRCGEQSAESRPRGKRAGPVGEHIDHAQDGVGSGRAVDERHVLVRLAEHGVVDDQLAHFERYIVGRDRGPHHVHFGRLVQQSRGRPQVGERGGTPLTGLVVEHESRTPGRAEVRGFTVVQHYVVLRRGPAHDDPPRAQLDSAAHEVDPQ